MDQSSKEVWTSGAVYESYVGRWSRPVAREFLVWLAVPAGASWLDVGCGTGALSRTILETTQPSRVEGIDPSPGYIVYARGQLEDDRVGFRTANAMDLPFTDASFDGVVSGLVLNFIPQPEVALSEMTRVAKPGGRVAAYVWDYAGKMQLMRRFWDAAVELNPAAAELDEGRRFPLCQPGPLRALFSGAGLREVEVRAIDIPTPFRDFDDYWTPFLGGQGPAPGYAVSLSETSRAELRERIRARLPVAPDGSIALIARAWAVQGLKPRTKAWG
ncbi:MAG TPA: methyltransferase domain-containing protein [Meiothermus sp.]|jgi:SAM-dependent methyltransferase|nr:methyltransferase domain-containing protein [Meiothermus sp.]